VGHYGGGLPKTIKVERARAFLDAGDSVAALQIFAGSGGNYRYNVDFYELFGCVLLRCGEIDNAGRFLFLSGVRRPEYESAIKSFLSKNSDPNNFRQLQSQLTKPARDVEARAIPTNCSSRTACIRLAGRHASSNCCPQAGSFE
jgi:hypothetical protein